MDAMPSIREMMCPVAEFPKIAEHAYFFDIVMALEKAHWDFRAEVVKQTILLVEDQEKNVIGKITPKDILRALEPQYDKIDVFSDDTRFGLPQTVESMKKDYFLWHEPFSNLCEKAWKIKAHDIYCKPTSTQSIDINDRIENAFHLFVTTRHEYLFVVDKEYIIGLLRFYDIYKNICKKIYKCERKSL